MKKILLSFLLTGLFIAGYCQNTDDEKAIKQLLEKESATWRSGDIKGHAECWHIQPCTKIVFSTDGGTMYDIPPEMIINPPANMAGNGVISVN